MKLHVNLTEEHIKLGQRQTKCHCPVALAISQNAIRNGLPSLVSVDFDGGRIGRNPGCGRHHVLMLPEEARNSVALFDAGKKIEPIEFEIEVTEVDTVKCSTNGSLDTELMRRCRE